MMVFDQNKKTFFVRKAVSADIPQIMTVYGAAREFMRQNGNPGQWTDGYPQEEVVRRDLADGHLFVGMAMEDELALPVSSIENSVLPQSSASGLVRPILGVFCHRPGPEPTYGRIEDGAWPDNEPYYVLHRIASAPGVHGFATFAIGWCLQRHPVLRVDTHQDNRPMLHLLSKLGFARCGIIHVENGTPRIAFQKEII